MKIQCGENGTVSCTSAVLLTNGVQDVLVQLCCGLARDGCEWSVQALNLWVASSKCTLSTCCYEKESWWKRLFYRFGVGPKLRHVKQQVHH